MLPTELLHDLNGHKVFVLTELHHVRKPNHQQVHDNIVGATVNSVHSRVCDWRKSLFPKSFPPVHGVNRSWRLSVNDPEIAGGPM